MARKCKYERDHKHENGQGTFSKHKMIVASNEDDKCLFLVHM